ncbi:hypothetical protein QR680_003766 [Steinernema hermaphroditum]|uniref:Uncharacterized protein n=1 Tax=Steinernema hermaphroditum TaxID=289476 RepID=A0AA39HNR6_9BILA|nr:hypothetical protein QR680_003766 [Steinernema hermaphroditum]
MDRISFNFVEEVCHLLSRFERDHLVKIPVWGPTASRFFKEVTEIYIKIYCLAHTSKAHVDIYTWYSGKMMMTYSIDQASASFSRVLLKGVEVSVFSNEDFHPWTMFQRYQENREIPLLTPSVSSRLLKMCSKEHFPMAINISNYEKRRSSFPQVQEFLKRLPRIGYIKTFGEMDLIRDVAEMAAFRGTLRKFSLHEETFSSEQFKWFIEKLCKCSNFQRLEYRYFGRLRIYWPGVTVPSIGYGMHLGETIVVLDRTFGKPLVVTLD